MNSFVVESGFNLISDSRLGQLEELNCHCTGSTSKLCDKK